VSIGPGVHESRTQGKTKFKVTAEALQSVLPHSICIELPDLDHRSTQDYGKPERIAPVLQLFFHPARPQPSSANA
jgi:hypothetical protein